MTQLVLGIPPLVVNLVQQGLLERAFHDGLYPQLLFRAEAQEEEWEGNVGQEIFMTRPGLLAPVTQPLIPGVDPVPQTLSYEQWSARLDRYGAPIDTHLPTNAVAAADLFNRNVHQLGLQAGQSLNRLVRNALFKPYLSGHTVTTAAALAGDSMVRVAALNGFADVIIRGVNVRPEAVSAIRPLPVTIAGVAGTRNVIGFLPDTPSDPWGPGTLYLDAALGAGVAARAPVVSAYAPKIIRSGGGLSIDAIAAGDVFQLQDAIEAVSYLRKNNVQPHEDGYYHAHISNDANSQVFTDPAFQRLNTALPDHTYYREAFIGTIAGQAFTLNNELPDETNSGDLTLTGTNALYASDIGAEVRNETGVGITRTIVTGRGSIYEKWLNEQRYVSEAGITGKIGEFQIVNAGMSIQTERIRLILRAPLNRTQDLVSAMWSYTGAFPVPTDVGSGSLARYKRAVVIESASNG